MSSSVVSIQVVLERVYTSRRYNIVRQFIPSIVYSNAEEINSRENTPFESWLIYFHGIFPGVSELSLNLKNFSHSMFSLPVAKVIGTTVKGFICRDQDNSPHIQKTTRPKFRGQLDPFRRQLASRD